MRVGVIAFLHESNTFISRPTTLEHFRDDVLLTGEAVREAFAPARHEVGGFFEGLEADGVDAVPIFAARAAPYGPLTAETFRHLLRMLLEELARAPDLDGLLLAPHGAMVSANHADADGHWMRCVRERIGPRVPIVATLDPHANVSKRMAGLCDALIAYRSNPHVDQRDRGIEAAALMTGILRGEIRPTMASCWPPLALRIDCQATEESPCAELVERFDAVRSRPDVLSCSLILGFRYADVPEMGTAAVVVTDDDRPLAQRLARELGEEIWNRRETFRGGSPGVEEAVARATSLPAPICLLDIGDNIGGGSPGDGTEILLELRRQRVGPSFVCLHDPEAVRDAGAAGTGALAQLIVGGKTDELHGPPLEATFSIDRLIDDGRFEETETRHGGATHFDQGPSAIVRTEPDLTLMLTSHRVPPFSLRQLTSFGIRPETFQVLVAKGVNAPLAAYGEVCKTFLRVDTPGVTTADMTRLSYRCRRKPLYPFETDFQWDAQPG